jgi:hypothetical protein
MQKHMTRRQIIAQRHRREAYKQVATAVWDLAGLLSMCALCLLVYLQ